MELNLLQIAHLYGPQILVASPPKPASQSAKAADSKDAPNTDNPNTGSNIVWRQRPEGQYCFILSENERKTPEFIDLLKKMVEYVKMPVEKVSFGFYNFNIQPNELSEMPTPIGIFFGHLPHFPQEDVLEFEDKKIFLLPHLSQVREQKSLKVKVVDILKGLI